MQGEIQPMRGEIKVNIRKLGKFGETWKIQKTRNNKVLKFYEFLNVCVTLTRFVFASGLVGTHWLFVTLYGHLPLIWGQPISVEVIGMTGLFVSCCQAQISLEMHWETGLCISLIEFIIAINFRSNCQPKISYLFPF